MNKPELELTDKEEKEIELSSYYVAALNGYGTDGHGRIMLINKLALYIHELEEYILEKESE